MITKFMHEYPPGSSTFLYLGPQANIPLVQDFSLVQLEDDFLRGGGGGGLLKYDLGRDMPLRLKVDPFLYQILLKNETHFYTRATNFKQNLLKMSHFFQKLLSFQANFGNFGIRLMKLGLFSCQF